MISTMITQNRSLPILLTWVLTGFVLVFICLTCVVVRLAWLSNSYYHAAQTAAQNQQDHEMIEACMGVVRNYFPGNPYCDLAVDKIIQKTEDLKVDNRQVEALTALKDLRAALNGIQSFYQPLANKLLIIEEHINKLEAAKNE